MRIMKKKLILLGIHLTAVALVLILTMVTLAWYTKNDTADTSETVITAQPIDDIGITDIVDNIVQYKGETGLGGIDAPYVATKIIEISQESSYPNDAVTCELTNVWIKKANGTEIKSTTEGFANIERFFTHRVKVVYRDENNEYVVKGTFYPNENGVLVDEDGNPLTYQDENYFNVSGTFKKQCTALIRLDLIFLDEASYVEYTTNGVTENVTAFKFSDYEYMGSTFYATFVIGMDEGSIIPTT